MKFFFRNMKDTNSDVTIINSKLYKLNLNKYLLNKIKLNNQTGNQISNNITDLLNRDDEKLKINMKNIITLKEISQKYDKWYLIEYSKQVKNIFIDYSYS